MRLNPPTLEKCQETTGFLFKHACFRTAACRCDTCGRLTCDEHTAAAGGAAGTAAPSLPPLPGGLPPLPGAAGGPTYCVACAKQAAKGRPVTTSHDPYDPYWYSTTHYRGYGYYGAGYWGYSYVRPFGSTPTSTAADASAAGAVPDPGVADPNDFTESDGGAFASSGSDFGDEADVSSTGSDFEMEQSGS